MSRWREGFKQIRNYPSAIVGLALIALLLGTALYTVLFLSFEEAEAHWRGGDVVQFNPSNAQPSWITVFGYDFPSTIFIPSDDEQRASVQRDGDDLNIEFEFDYTYREFPSEMKVFLRGHFSESAPYARLRWHTPDERVVPLGGHRVGSSQRVEISHDRRLERRFGGAHPHVGLLAEPDSLRDEDRDPEVLQGTYRLEILVDLMEEGSDVEAIYVCYGRVFGLAGTDHRRRDITVALLWGTPVALAFGLLAAVGTTITTLIIAAIGVWFGGLVDAAIQRVTEVNMILPLLPILVMIGTLYSTSIWLMLGVVILLGIFSAGIKMYRAMLLPIREAPYIEAARAYGVGHLRIVFRYMIPRVLPVLIPSFVTLIPTFVFLEASLAVLGLGDPILPTWGKVLHDAQAQSALYNGFYYWVLGPALMLMLTGLGFAMFGFALDRIFNPRLRQV